MNDIQEEEKREEKREKKPDFTEKLV